MRNPATLMLISFLMVAQAAVAEEPAANFPATNRSANATAPRKLDLRLPDIRTIFSQATIEAVLNKTRDGDTIEEVEVEGERSRVIPSTPSIPGGLFAPFWALAHPTQAWRIFTPLAPDQAQLMASTPLDATDSYRAALRPRGVAIGD
jgi:hypothetical protein